MPCWSSRSWRRWGSPERHRTGDATAGSSSLIRRPGCAAAVGRTSSRRTSSRCRQHSSRATARGHVSTAPWWHWIPCSEEGGSMQSTTFQKGMAYLSAAYGTELCRERLAVYWDQLQHLEDGGFLAAVKAHVAAKPRFPAVAELRELYRQQCQPQALVHRLPRPRRADAEQARRVLDALKSEVRRVRP